VADDHLMDDVGELRRRLKFHLQTHDVLVLSGGVSMGNSISVTRGWTEHRCATSPERPTPWVRIEFAIDTPPLSTSTSWSCR